MQPMAMLPARQTRTEAVRKHSFEPSGDLSPIRVISGHHGVMWARVIMIGSLTLVACKHDSHVTDDGGGSGDAPASCGNGVLDPGETCDPPGSCASCDDGNACTTDITTGAAATCDLRCRWRSPRVAAVMAAARPAATMRPTPTALHRAATATSIRTRPAIHQRAA